MSKNNDKNNCNCGCKKNIKPSDIKGKIEIPDTRERQDGPGGN